MNQFRPQGSSHTPILVFAGIVGLSVGFFFLFSLGGFEKKPAPPPPAPREPAPQANNPVTPPPVPSPAVVTPPVPAGVPAVEVAASPEALLAEIAARLRAGNFESAMKLAVPEAASGPRAEFLKRVVADCGWRVPEGNPWTDAGVVMGASRRELKLEPAFPAAPVPAGPVTADIERDKDSGWKVKAWRFDPALVSQAAALLKTESVAIDTSAVTETPDPLEMARQFFAGVLRHDFKSARGMTDEKAVTHEKLAGMCIVFEEGEYRIVERRPVVVTAGTADSAWAIVKIRSDKQNLDSEVGLEMHRSSGGEWRIHSLDFNRMLESYVQASGAGNVFYSPIVKSAKGGESIVLYFEFDRAELHPRALHQLDIIAGLLKSDPARKMRITGHTDALGSDDYNAQLSATRARNVQAKLLELGVAQTQIETVGFGAKAPLDANRRADGSDNPEGRSRNRRTEIYLDF